MSIHASSAERLFKLNLQAIGKTAAGTPTDPFQWNLHSGLIELARAIADLESQLKDVQNTVRAIQHMR